MHPLNRPEVMITFAPEKFDENGNLRDEQAKKLIADLLTALVSWTRKLKER
jgi:chromate reductase